MAEENTQENKENLENMKELVEKFERKYGKKAKELRQQEQKKEKKEFSWKLPREFMTKLLYGQGKKKIQKRKRKEIEQELEKMKTFLGTKKLKGGTMLREPQKGNNFLCI